MSACGREVQHHALAQAAAPDHERAAQVGDVDAMRLLVARGADPRIATAEGVTPLLALSGSGFYGNDDRTVPAGRMPAVKYLVEEIGASVNEADTAARGREGDLRWFRR